MREVTGVVPRLPGKFVEDGRWHVVFQGRWEYDADINEKEARVILMAVRRAARSWRLHGRRVLGCSDNLSALLSFERGRSSSHALRMLCCRAAAYFVGTEMQWPLRYVESERNAADYASRVGNRNDQVYLDRDVQRAVKGLFDLEHEGGVEGEGEGQARSHQAPLRQRPRRRAEQTRRCRRRRAFLELFAGSGRLSAAIAELGASCSAATDARNGQHHDVCDARVRRVIRGWISSGRIAYVHSAHHAACRHSARCRQGREAPEGLACARASADLIRVCKKFGVAWTLENPAHSSLWSWKPIATLCRGPDVEIARLDACAYGAHYMKPTA